MSYVAGIEVLETDAGDDVKYLGVALARTRVHPVHRCRTHVLLTVHFQLVDRQITTSLNKHHAFDIWAKRPGICDCGVVSLVSVGNWLCDSNVSLSTETSRTPSSSTHGQLEYSRRSTSSETIYRGGFSQRCCPACSDPEWPFYFIQILPAFDGPVSDAVTTRLPRVKVVSGRWRGFEKYSASTRWFQCLSTSVCLSMSICLSVCV